MTSFVTSRNRDASAVISGYVYQVDLTILRWLSLQAGQSLELECGEDIDTVTAALQEDSLGDQVAQQRLLEQIKRYTYPISLRTPAVVGVVASAVEHLQTNPNLDLRFCFTTTASERRERLSPLPGRVPAIIAWEALRKGELSPEAQRATLSGIRSLLANSTQPQGLADNTWRSFSVFVTTSSEEQFLDFVRRFEWSTRADNPELVALQIQAILIDRRSAKDSSQAHALYQRLFFYVFKLVSSQGIKRLEHEDLHTQLAEPPLSEADAALFGRIISLLADLDTRVNKLEQRQTEQEQTVQEVRVKLLEIASSQGISLPAITTESKPFLNVPPIPAYLSPRKKRVEDLLGIVQGHAWTAIHGSIGSGKTQLAILIAHAHGHCRAWVRLKGRHPKEASAELIEVIRTIAGTPTTTDLRNWYRQLCAQLGAGALLVIDDVPRLDGTDELSAHLVQLAMIASEAQVRFLTTSPYRPPQRVRSALGGRALREVPIPLFDDDEARALVLAHGAPESILNDTFVSSINSLAQRHPLKLAALARYLEERGWEMNNEILSSLLKSEYTRELNTETTHVLLQNIQDTESRELLYRLGLSLERFAIEDVIAVAQADPPIGRPNEHLDALLGVWVQFESDVLMSVSPLVASLGGRDLKTQTYRACHALYGKRIMMRGTIGPPELVNALAHFSSAEEYNQAALALIIGLTELSNVGRQAPDWGLPQFWTATALPASIDLGLRIYLRMRQILARHHRGLESAFITKDLDVLIAQATEREAWAILVVVALAPIGSDGPIDAAKLTEYLHLFLKYSSTAQLPGGGRLLREIVPLPPEAMIWWYLTNINTIEQWLSWLDDFAKLSPEQREIALSDDNAEEGCMVFADRIWYIESYKAPSEQQWQRVLSALRKLEEHAKQLSVELLWACSIRSQIIVLSEYSNELSTSIELLERALHEASSDPRVQFVLRATIGLQPKMPSDEALGWLQTAIAQETNVYPYDRILVLLRASKLTALADAQSAITYAKEAVELAKSSPLIPETELVKALCELSTAYHLGGDLVEAFDVWDEAGEKLLAIKANSEVWKGLFVVYGHCSGYFARLATTGQPPKITNDGEEYVPPQMGMFITEAPERAKYYDSTNMEDRICYIMANLAMFAGGVGNAERTIAWAMRGFDLARATHQTVAISGLGYDVVPALLINDKYGEAIDAALETGVGAIAVRLDHQRNIKSAKLTVDVDEFLGPKPNENWKNVESFAMEIGLLPCFFRLCTVALDEPLRAREYAKELASSCRQVGAGSIQPVIWETAARLIEETFLEPLTAKELIARPTTFQEKNDYLHAIAYIGACLQVDCSPEMALQIQVAIGPVIDQLRGTSRSSRNLSHRLVIVPFFARYWTIRFARARFRFVAPKLVEEALVAAQHVPADEQPEAILRAIALGLYVRLSTEAKGWLSGKPPNKLDHNAPETQG